ncbi:ribosomal RNA small subunit methyltransferase A [Patescibacteria group bacterium]|nr:ribosomal RNA small subunit methyltransferase A [Patescibacteria group bacterium]
MAKLGQNFLQNKKIAEEIIEAAEIKKDDIILEVGPGKGILTEKLLAKAGQVIAVEKDPSLVEFLKQKFSGAKNLEIIQDDILRFNPFDKLRIKNFKIVANIPYYITSHFLRQFLGAEHQPSLMVLMIQKEVAERIVMRDKKASILSLSVNAYGQPKIIKKVPAGNFSPTPKVDSAVIKINNISKNFFNDGSSTSIIDEQKFFNLIKKGFSQKRKMLKNNLNISIETLRECGIPEKTRAEDLSLGNWKCLYFAVL